MTSSWEKASSIASILAVVMSISALAVSIKSCEQAEEALNLQAKEFESQRLAVWEGLADDKNENISISSINQDITLHSVFITFPEGIYDSKWKISPPKFQLPLLDLRVRLIEKVNTRLPKKGGYIQIGQSHLPVLVEANYLAKGEMFYDRSIYLIDFIYTQYDAKHKAPSIEFNSLRFLYRMKNDESFVLVLNNFKLNESILFK